MSEWTSRRDYTRNKLPGPQYLYSVRLSVCLKPKFDELFCRSCLNLRCPRTNKKLHSALCSSLFTKQRKKISQFFLLLMTKKSLNYQYGHFSTWHEYVTYVDCTASWRRRVIIENILIFLSLFSHFP